MAGTGSISSCPGHPRRFADRPSASGSIATGCPAIVAKPSLHARSEKKRSGGSRTLWTSPELMRLVRLESEA